jgi:hypothetical protein
MFILHVRITQSGNAVAAEMICRWPLRTNGKIQFTARKPGIFMARL